MTAPRPRLALLPALVLLIAACSPGGSAPTVPPPAATAGPTESPSAREGGIPASCPTGQPEPLGADEERQVTFKTAEGDIVMRIDGALSPVAAGNFVALAECGYYTGTVFHRIVPAFVIQGGDGQYGRQPNVDFNQVGRGGPGYTIEDEPVSADYVRGTVAMARTPEPDSQGSQFFIVLDDEVGPGLAQADPPYAILGEVTSGMEVADEISRGSNGGDSLGNLALSPVTIDEVIVETP